MKLYFAHYMYMMCLFQMSTVDQARIDAFRAKIEQRKACEKKAFQTSMQLIEEEKVNDDTLMNAVDK